MSNVTVNETHDSSSTDNVISSSDEEDRWRETKPPVEDLPSDYWTIQKLFRYVKSGNAIPTMVSLCCVTDIDLTRQINQMAIRDCGGIDILVNLLDTNDIQCRLCALRLLATLSLNIDIRKYIFDLSVVPSLLRIMREPAIDLRIVASNVIANVAGVRAARAECRKWNAIQILVDALDVPLETIKKTANKLSVEEVYRIELLMVVCYALTALFVSRRNRELGRRFGIIPLAARLLKSSNHHMIEAVLRLVLSCTSDISFQLGIATEKMLPDIIGHLARPNNVLKETSAFVLMACAADSDLRRLIRIAGGLGKLVDALGVAAVATSSSDRLLESATGAIWKSAQSMENVVILSKQSTLGTLIDLAQRIDNTQQNVWVNITGAIGELLRLPANRSTFRGTNVLHRLVINLSSTNCSLLVNTCKALELYGEESYSGPELESLDAVRLMWSLLRHERATVQIAAAHALCPYIELSTNASVIIRNFVGGFEIVIKLLKSTQTAVLAAAARLVSTVARDTDNLAILTDFGIVDVLSDLICTHDDELREHLAAAIASCAPYASNTQLFGRNRIVTPLVGFCSSSSWRVHRTTAMALEMLSADIQNCLTLHKNGVAPFLLDLLYSNDEDTQKAASKCLANMRKMAMTAEQTALNTIKNKK